MNYQFCRKLKTKDCNLVQSFVNIIKNGGDFERWVPFIFIRIIVVARFQTYKQDRIKRVGVLILHLFLPHGGSKESKRRGGLNY